MAQFMGLATYSVPNDGQNKKQIRFINDTIRSRIDGRLIDFISSIKLLSASFTVQLTCLAGR